jgi:hypothetical protein
MTRRDIHIILGTLLLHSLWLDTCHAADTVSFKLYPRYSFFTNEKKAEMLLHVPSGLAGSELKVSLVYFNKQVCEWSGKPGKKMLRLFFDLDSSSATGRVTAEIKLPGAGIAERVNYFAPGEIIILPFKPNEVKTDRLTGGLIVNGRPFFPFGFYCYSPVYPTLPEEEAVKGFNMMSPYQKIVPATFSDRKAYMDRCASLGMKVNYNILSVSGGGGVGSGVEGLSGIEKKKLLVNEINAFKDHPALLSWYVADEPNGNKISPDSLLKIYNILKAEDPWHPVSIVFMAPFMSAVKYVDALDIVMADPYPVPGMPLELTGSVAGNLVREFEGKKPVWIVPQAFGGGELWRREPTIQEIRAMTYQSVISGARGIQYFVRQGLHFFPKSAATWGECGRMATEIASITPWLLSDEERIPVTSLSPGIMATSGVHDGQLLIVAANRKNEPGKAGFSINIPLTARAKVLFENRSLQVTGGVFHDVLPALGTQVYLIDIKPGSGAVKPWPGNLVIDPGFEDVSSPGIPASCYARPGGDRGATYFLDSREHAEGNFSLRLITPSFNEGVRLRFFPVKIMSGRSYFVSIRARSEPLDCIHACDNKNHPRYFEIRFGDIATRRFTLQSCWKEFTALIEVPSGIDSPLKVNIVLNMPTAGTAWFDLLQVQELIETGKCINPALAFP